MHALKQVGLGPVVLSRKARERGYEPPATPVRLTGWAVGYRGTNEFAAPELCEYCLEGVVEGHPRKKDGTHVLTSAIVGTEGRLVRTASGTTYELVGEPNADYAQYLQEMGRGYDPDNPVKVFRQE